MADMADMAELVNDNYKDYDINESKEKITISELIKYLSNHDIKIKFINPTNFGTEIILYSKDDAKKIKKIFPDTQIVGTSVFIDKRLMPDKGIKY